MNKLRQLIFCALVCSAAIGSASAQTNSPQNISALNGCARFDVGGLTTLGIQVTGTWSATLQPEVTIAGSNTVVNAQVTPSTSSTPQATITTNGAYVASVAGYNTFFLCATSYSSGTATVYFWGSTHPSSSAIGTAGGGTLTGVTQGTGITVTGGAPSPTVSVTNPVPSGTQCYPLVNTSSGTGATYATSQMECDVSRFSGATMDVQIASALAALPSGGGVLNAYAINGTQTWAANPLAALVGSGYSPNTFVTLKLCNVTINTKATVTLTSGVHLEGCGRESVTIQAAISGFPVTATGTVTSTSAGTGTPYISSWAGSSTSLTSNYQGSIAAICVGAAYGISCGINFGTVNYGQIQTITGGTAWTVYANNASNSTANATGTYSFVVFSPVILMGDMSGSSGANPNFDVSIKGVHIGTQGQLGAIPLAVYNCQQQCTADDFTLSPSNSQALDLESSQAQEAGPFSNFWIAGSDCQGTSTFNPIGIMSRMNGSSITSSIRDFSVALNGCFTSGNGATYPIVVDSQAHIGPGVHVLLGAAGNNSTVGVYISKTTQVTCPVFCIAAPSSVNGAIIEDVNAAGNGGLAAIGIGTNNSPTNVRISGLKAATGATGFTDTFFDQNNSCTIIRPTSGSVGASLNEYILNEYGGIAFSTSTACPNLPQFVGAMYNTSQYTNATAALTTIATSPTIQADWLLDVDCTVTYGVTGTAETASFTLTTSQTPADISFGGFINYSATAGIGSLAKAASGGLITSGGAVSSTAGIYQAEIHGTILWNASTAGTFTLQGESGNTAGTLTIAAYASNCKITREF
jgi:hypothetical protein